MRRLRVLQEEEQDGKKFEPLLILDNRVHLFYIEQLEFELNEEANEDYGLPRVSESELTLSQIYGTMHATSFNTVTYFSIFPCISLLILT